MQLRNCDLFHFLEAGGFAAALVLCFSSVQQALWGCWWPSFSILGPGHRAKLDCTMPISIIQSSLARFSWARHPANCRIISCPSQECGSVINSNWTEHMNCLQQAKQYAFLQTKQKKAKLFFLIKKSTKFPPPPSSFWKIAFQTSLTAKIHISNAKEWRNSVVWDEPGETTSGLSFF